MSCQIDDFEIFYPWFYGGELKSLIINNINNPEDFVTMKYQLINLMNDLKNIEIKPNSIINIHIGFNSENSESPYLSNIRNSLSYVHTNSTTQYNFMIDKFYTDLQDNVTSVNNKTITTKYYNTFFPTYLSVDKVFIKTDKYYNIISDNAIKDIKFIQQFYKVFEKFVNIISKTQSIIFVWNSSVYGILNSTSTLTSKGLGNISCEMFSELLNFIPYNRFYIFSWIYNTQYYVYLKQFIFFKYTNNNTLLVDIGNDIVSFNKDFYEDLNKVNKYNQHKHILVDIKKTYIRTFTYLNPKCIGIINCVLPLILTKFFYNV
jgi:hypothetical protein